MTEQIIARRLPRPLTANACLVPGRCRADLDRLAAEFGVPFERGPDELEGSAGLFRQGRPRAGSVAPRHPHLRRDRRCIGAHGRCDPRARRCDARGGRRCDRPRLPARHAVSASRGRGTRAEPARDSRSASIRPMPSELRARRAAGANFLLSLTEHTLDLAAGTAATPVLVPATHGDLRVAAARRRGRRQARHRSAARSDPRPDPFRLHGLAVALRRAAQHAARRPKC